MFLTLYTIPRDKKEAAQATRIALKISAMEISEQIFSDSFIMLAFGKQVHYNMARQHIELATANYSQDLPFFVTTVQAHLIMQMEGNAP